MGPFCRKSELPPFGSGTREVAGEHRNWSGDASILMVMFVAGDSTHSDRFNALWFRRRDCSLFAGRASFFGGVQRLSFHVKAMPSHEHAVQRLFMLTIPLFFSLIHVHRRLFLLAIVDA
jgi:hypothetical protein